MGTVRQRDCVLLGTLEMESDVAYAWPLIVLNLIPMWTLGPFPIVLLKASFPVLAVRLRKWELSYHKSLLPGCRTNF